MKPLYFHIRDTLKPDVINAILIREIHGTLKRKNWYTYYEELNDLLKQDYSSGKYADIRFSPMFLMQKTLF